MHVSNQYHAQREHILPNQCELYGPYAMIGCPLF